VADELGALAERLTVGETYFFRLKEHFQVLTDVVVPARLAARGSERTLRVLSAGCSSGVEAYSVAIALRESIQELSSWDLRICGIDINPAALKKAAVGRYSTWSLRETPDPLRGPAWHERIRGGACPARRPGPAWRSQLQILLAGAITRISPSGSWSCYP
jgi:chemotaxis protein methyltransferase CheR